MAPRGLKRSTPPRPTPELRSLRFSRVLRSRLNFTHLHISTLFYFGVVYFTIEFERKKKKQGGNYGQIFPKIVHQKIIIVFEMQYSFCQTLNAIQTNIKESKAFKRINLRLR